MKHKVVLFFTFASGVAVGVAGTWKYFRDKYEQITQEEIDSVKEVFSRREAETSVKTASVNADDSQPVGNEKPSITEYAAKLQKEGYVNYSDMKSEEKEEDMLISGPYVIAPEAFMEHEEYDHVSFTYYADGVLTDENDEVIDDVEDVIGEDSLNHFGEFEDDSVYVQNDARRIYYEILLDQRLYSEVVKQQPHQMEE
jgi:hypothetical protein